MTITLRIQYKGEGARRLAAEEKVGRSESPRYLQEVMRVLGLFSIPSPDHTLPIYKSGFVVCNYNTTRQSVSMGPPLSRQNFCQVYSTSIAEYIDVTNVFDLSRCSINWSVAREEHRV